MKSLRIFSLTMLSLLVLCSFSATKKKMGLVHPLWLNGRISMTVSVAKQQHSFIVKNSLGYRPIPPMHTILSLNR